MKQKLRVFCTLLLLAVASVLPSWAQSDYSAVYTSNVTLNSSTGSSATDCKVVISNTEYDGLKAGTSKAAGEIKLTIPSGTKYLHIHAAGWKGETVVLSITPNSYSSTKSVNLTSDNGIQSNSPFTFEGDASSEDFYKVITFTNALSNDVTLTFKPTSGKRFVVWGVNSEAEGSSETSFAPTISGDESFVTSTTVTLSAAEGASIYYTTNGDEPTTSSTLYESPFTLTETTTVKAIAVEEGKEASAVVEKTFTKVEVLANLAALTSKTEAGSYHVTLSNAVVTYVNGNYAYIQDASGAVVMYKSGHGLTAGQVFNGTANVTYQLRNNNPQLTAMSGVTPTDGTAPEPTEVAASAWNSTISAELSKYYKITGATITNTNGKYYITLGTETVQLYGQGDANPVSVSDLEATYTVIGFPTLYNTTAELQIFEQPTAETVTRQELSMTFTGGTLEFTDASDFVAPTLSITDESGTSVSGLTITYESSNTSVANVNASGIVTIGSEYGTATITATFAGNDDYVEATASYTIVYSNSSQGDFTWDLSKASHASATDDLVTWSCDYATMTLSKGESSTAANNYLGGTNNHTRLYKDQILSITPAAGYRVNSITITAVSNYVSGFTGNTWTNATVSTNGTTITVTPTDASQAVSVAISAACRATAVNVTYELDNTPAIAIAPTSVEATSDEKSGILTVSYLNIADNSTAAVILCDAEGNAATYDWIEVDLDASKNVEYLIGANTTSNARTAYIKVTVGEVASNVVAITQAKFDYATLPFEYDGNGQDELPTGLTQSGVDSYTSSPSMKFDASGDNLILKMNEAPKVLYFDIKGNSFSGGTFTVQTSTNGTDYTDLATYTELTSDVQTEMFTNIGTDVRYIKWIYTEKKSGNVALGNIIASNVAPETIDVNIGESATGADGAYYSSVYYSDKALKVPEGVVCLTYKVDGGALTVSKTYSAGDVIPANEAVVIKASAFGTVTFLVTLATADKDKKSMLLGVDEATTINEAGNKYYKLTLNAANEEGTAGFYFDKGVTDGSTINAAAHKCYLCVPVNQTNGAKGFVFGDDTDGIGQIENGELTIENSVVYDLSGRKLNEVSGRHGSLPLQLPKGIYIVNGKKVVVK